MKAMGFFVFRTTTTTGSLHPGSRETGDGSAKPERATSAEAEATTTRGGELVSPACLSASSSAAASRWRAEAEARGATAAAAAPPPPPPPPPPSDSNFRSVDPPPPGSSGCLSLLSPFGERRGTGAGGGGGEIEEEGEESSELRSSVVVVVVAVAVPAPPPPSTFLHSRGSSPRALASPRERRAAYEAATRGWKSTGDGDGEGED